MGFGRYRFRRSFGQVGSQFRGARPNTYPPSGGLDPATQAFAAESGATDVTGINDLIKYVRGQGLYDNFVMYPMKSAQNAGSGSTVYGIGGSTGNDMTLVNSPTWGATGITFNGTSQYGRVSDFWASGTVNMFARVSQSSATPSNIESIFGQYDAGADDRSIQLAQNGPLSGDPYFMYRSSDGTLSGAAAEIYETGSDLGSVSDRTIFCSWINGDGRSLWFNNVPVSMSLRPGFTSQTSRHNSSADITFAATLNNNAMVGPADLLGINMCLIHGVTLTDTQRETITDLINAL